MQRVMSLIGHMLSCELGLSLVVVSISLHYACVMLVRFPALPACAKAFQRVPIPDGTWRSICLHCFLTAAKAQTKDGLEDGEQEHDCSKVARERDAVA